MTATFELRAPIDEDVDGLVELHNRGFKEIGDPPVVTDVDIRFEWSSPGFDRERHARVAVADGQLVGSSELHVQDGRVRVDGLVDAAYRGRGIGTALVTWAVETSRGEPDAREMYLGAPATRADAIKLIEEQPGFTYARSFYKMLHRAPGEAPEPRWPDGITLATLEGEALGRAAVEAHDRSFIDHWNYSPAQIEHRLHWMKADPDHEPELWMIATKGDDIAGFALNFLMGTKEQRVGIVGQLGTSRGYRGIGLGRALLCEALRRLAARGADAVELGVDAENPTGALQLYRSAGFEVVRENRAYRLMF